MAGIVLTHLKLDLADTTAPTKNRPRQGRKRGLYPHPLRWQVPSVLTFEGSPILFRAGPRNRSGKSSVEVHDTDASASGSGSAHELLVGPPCVLGANMAIEEEHERHITI